MAAFPMCMSFVTSVFHMEVRFHSLQIAEEGSDAFGEERNGRGQLVRAVVLTT